MVLEKYPGFGRFFVQTAVLDMVATYGYLNLSLN